MPRLDFDPAAHRYTLDGRPVPSVTQALEILNYFDGIPAAVLEKARIRGQYVDEACTLLIRDELDWDTVDPEHLPLVRGFANWLTDAVFVPIAVQLRVASPTARYAGTIDLIGEVGTTMSLVDVKASHDPPASVGPQTAAYAKAALESYGHRIQRRYCLHLHDRYPRGYRLNKLNNASDYNVFLSCLNIHQWRIANG